MNNLPIAWNLLCGDATEEMKRHLDNQSARLIMCSPPYNLGKEYESPQDLPHYLNGLQPVWKECARVLRPRGSLVLQVGNFIDRNRNVWPLDVSFIPLLQKIGFRLKNRIIWTFNHGLHCTRRFSGRYEVALWFTLDYAPDGYPYITDHLFNLDDVRVPSKYPHKTHYKPGPKYGTLSGNPKGKNPGDVWELISAEFESGVMEIPNVKANHPEKEAHPCQYPVELCERFVLALTNEMDVVVDPFCGTGSTVIAAVKRGRLGIGIDTGQAYLDIARSRLEALDAGTLKCRELGKPIHKPSPKAANAAKPSSPSNPSTTDPS